MLDRWPKEHRYLLSIDESGTDDIKRIKKRLEAGEEICKDDRYLAITGIIMERSHFPEFKESILNLKKQYWPPDGLYEDRGSIKRVCFHSTAIRKGAGPFSSDVINYSKFMKDLSAVLKEAPATVIASCIDKKKEAILYPDPQHKFGHPYGLGMTFIVERFAIFLRRRRSTGVILLEARGKKPDRFVHRFVMNILKNGTDFMTSKQLSCIQGLYFAPKWHPDNCRASFLTLELADLYSYPIYQFVRDGHKSRPFEIVEQKFDHYPDYMRYGLKLFPE